MTPKGTDGTRSDMNLRDAMAPTPVSEGVFSIDVPDGWQQGRGAFGGLVLGMLVRAIEACEPEADRRLRTLTGEIPSPVLTGPSELRVETIRRGNGVSAFHARLVQQGEVVALATAVLAKARSSSTPWSPAPPVLPVYSESPVIAIGPPLGPTFAQHVEFRPTGLLPFSGAKQAGAAGWVRMREPLDRIGAAEVVAFCDSYWPAQFAMETAPRPMSTLAFTMQIATDLAQLDPAQPFFFRSSAPFAHDGFVLEQREVWTADGTLVATNQQTFVVVK